jgi:hypothetical protein
MQHELPVRSQLPGREGADNQATKDKKAFTALWMAVADEYGLPLFQYNQI